MAESPTILLFLWVIASCVVVMTAALIVLARDTRRTLRRLYKTLPEMDRALRETRTVMRQGRRVVGRADRMTREVEVVVGRACEAALETMDRIGRWRSQAESFLTEQVGNGARNGSRRRYRS